MLEVIFVTRILTHYRIPFHQSVHNHLANAGISYRLLYSAPAARETKKNDLANLPWAEEVPANYLGTTNICWQKISDKVRAADLVIIGQENSLLHNYILQTKRLLGGPKLAFFGHGRNFQSRSPNGLAERFKNFWINKVDWWFAYTQRSADFVVQSGFPRNKITVFNNAIDTSSISHERSALIHNDQEIVRQTLLAGSENIGVYVGGMYPEKRLDFLIESARDIKKSVLDFQLMFIGGGEEEHIAREAADQYDWVHYLGPKFGAEKTALVALARVFLMPGLVGLGVLDSFAYGTPMVTTNYPYHSPEIDYLEDGINGVIVEEQNNPHAYAAAVTKVLMDTAYREKLQEGAKQALATYTIEVMAERFANGVTRALTHSKKPR